MSSRRGLVVGHNAAVPHSGRAIAQQYKALWSCTLVVTGRVFDYHDVGTTGEVGNSRVGSRLILPILATPGIC